MTDFTVTDKKALRGEILHVRKQGYADHRPGAAPRLPRRRRAARRYDGATIAAVCVAAWVEDSSMGSFAEKYSPP